MTGIRTVGHFCCEAPVPCTSSVLLPYFSIWYQLVCSKCVPLHIHFNCMKHTYTYMHILKMKCMEP
uniref:Uncharacterized protein n=1 Tax=Anguilla anguilla TaxID=7936 RepID=A0A0E9UNG7_ANGAN